MKKYKTFFWILFILLIASILYIYYWLKYVCIKASSVNNGNGGISDDFSYYANDAVVPFRNTVPFKSPSLTNRQVVGSGKANVHSNKLDIGFSPNPNAGFGGTGRVYNSPQK
jgi:hypothetical protein